MSNSKQLSLNNKKIETLLNNFALKLQNSAFNNQSFWLNSDAQKTLPTPDFFAINQPIEEFTHPYVHKLVVSSQSTLCLMGDFHGSVHSLMRNLWRLVLLGYIDTSLKIIKPDFYFIFLGDYVDRGRYGIEVLMLLLHIKLNNWENTLLCRGNHELKNISRVHGFFSELKTKYPHANSLDSNDNSLFDQIAHWYEFLPLAVYVGAGNNPDFAQCSHGGIDKAFNPEQLLKSPLPEQFQKLTREEVLNGSNCCGFHWSDFHQGINTQDANRGNNIQSFGSDSQDLKKSLKQGISCFFRGHQDMAFGCKMFAHSKNIKINRSPQGRVESVLINNQKTKYVFSPAVSEKNPDSIYHIYPDGPYHWQDVVTEQDQHEKNRVFTIIIPTNYYAHISC